MSFWEHFDRLVEILQRPAVFITLILITILLVLSFEYGNMQRQLNLMEDHINKMHKRETSLVHELHRLQGDVVRVKNDERKLKAKESSLENELGKTKKEIKQIKDKDSWGEDNSDSGQMTVHQEPLKPHQLPSLPGFPGFLPFHLSRPPMIENLFEGIKKQIDKIKHKDDPQHKEFHFELPHFSFMNGMPDLPEIEEIKIIDLSDPNHKK